MSFLFFIIIIFIHHFFFLKVELTALNFNVLPPQPGMEGNIQANKAMAAEAVRKRNVYKKSKSAQKNVSKVLGKDAGKFAKGLMKMF